MSLCTRCGQPGAYLGFTSVECISAKCPAFSPKHYTESCKERSLGEIHTTNAFAEFNAIVGSEAARIERQLGQALSFAANYGQTPGQIIRFLKPDVSMDRSWTGHAKHWIDSPARTRFPCLAPSTPCPAPHNETDEQFRQRVRDYVNLTLSTNLSIDMRKLIGADLPLLEDESTNIQIGAQYILRGIKMIPD